MHMAQLGEQSASYMLHAPRLHAFTRYPRRNAQAHLLFQADCMQCPQDDFFCSLCMGAQGHSGRPTTTTLALQHCRWRLLAALRQRGLPTFPTQTPSNTDTQLSHSRSQVHVCLHALPVPERVPGPYHLRRYTPTCLTEAASTRCFQVLFICDYASM